MSYHKSRGIERRIAREEFAYVLDFLPNGNPVDTHHPSHRVKPIAQALGDKYFTLLEFHPKPGIIVQQGEKVYVGFSRRELRDKVDYVWGGIVLYEELTSVAKSYLPEAIRKIVMERERVFVEFFNIYDFKRRFNRSLLLPFFNFVDFSNASSFHDIEIMIRFNEMTN